MERIVIRIGGEDYAPSRLLWLWLHLPTGIVFRRAGDVRPGDRVSFEVQTARGLRPVEGEVEAVGLHETSAAPAQGTGQR